MMLKLSLKNPRPFATAIAWMGRWEDAVNDPIVMAAGVKHIGKGMAENFKSEGSYAGGAWAELSETTKRVRRQRGYNPEHPILQQSGGLKRITADTLSGWGESTSSQVGFAGNTGMVASVSRRRFQAIVRGPKVENHWGGTVRLKDTDISVRLPRRRFFGITTTAADEANKAIFDKITSKWGRMSRNVKVTKS